MPSDGVQSEAPRRGGAPLTWPEAQRWAVRFRATGLCWARARREEPQAAHGCVVVGSGPSEPWFVFRSAAAGAIWLRALTGRAPAAAWPTGSRADRPRGDGGGDGRMVTG
jgi:hypothetical protein